MAGIRQHVAFYPVDSIEEYDWLYGPRSSFEVKAAMRNCEKKMDHVGRARVSQGVTIGERESVATALGFIVGTSDELSACGDL